MNSPVTLPRELVERALTALHFAAKTYDLPGEPPLCDELRARLAQPQGPSVTELLAAIREHKLDVAMADADTHKADRKLWSHLPDEG